ncbi:DUF945 family protein [Vibrio paucivorans]
MNQLKKLGAIGGAVALVLCWPLAVGQIGENVITDAINHVDNDAVAAEIISYDRGYLSSQVQTRYSIVDESLKAQFIADGLPTEFIVNSDVSHGLASLTALSTLQDVDFPLSVETTTQLNGNTDYVVNLASWHHQTQGEDSVTISTSPASISGSVTVLGQLSYVVDLPSVELDFATGEKITIADVDGNGEGKQEKGFWLGKQSISLGEFSIRGVDGSQAFSMNKSEYQFSSDLNKEQGRLNSNHIVTMESLLTPEGAINDFQLDFSLGDVDSQSFEQLVALYQESPVLTETEIQKAIPYIETLFAKGFYLSMNKMALKVGEGDFESKWKVSVPEGTDNIAQNPAKILPSLTGKLNTYFSNQIVADYPFIKQGVDEAIIMEMISQTNEGYEINADLKDGNLVFASGQEIPVAALLLPVVFQQ